MAAYIVFMRDKMVDPGEFEKYMAAVPGTLEGHPVRPLAIYGKLEMLEGPPIEGAVIAEFESYEAALAWYRSPAYQQAVQHRFKAGEYRVFVLQGL
jgi:uncharacterized protein (DUF1330 family)